MTTAQNLTEITSPLIESLQAELAKYEKLDPNASVAFPCYKCGGRGYGGWPVDGGRCWNCNATGATTRVVKNIRRGLKAEITTERKSIVNSAKVAAEREARQGEFNEQHADLVKALGEWNGRYRDDYLLADLENTLRVKGFLTDNQVAAAEKALQMHADRKSAHDAAEDVPAGRVQVTGQVLSTKTVESQFGRTYKMLVLDDRGFKVFGTVPASIPGAEKGDRVTFTAKLEPSHDDSKFGFYSRPTKAEYLDDPAEEE